MNKQIIFGVTLCLALAFVSAIPTRQDQSCETQYASWYYSGQQCMQCYSYGQDSNEICQKCSGDKCSGCHSNASLGVKKINIRSSSGEIVEQEINYCRKCGSDENIAECCWMDDKQKIQVQDNTFGVENTATLGFHATKCLTPKQTYTNFSGEVKTATSDAIKQYGSVCYTIQNCKTIGDYGRCMTCQDGYYLDNQLACKLCNSHPWISDNSELANPLVNLVKKSTDDNGRCVKCNGPSQCSECGIFESGSKWYGSYLATNQGREFHDLNIAKNPSFCRTCSENCQCTDATNLCATCIDGTSIELGTVGGYYYNPNTQQCYPCNSIDDLCNQCKWVEELNKAICVGCQSRTDKSGSTAFQGYNKEALTFNGDDSYNVLQFPKTYYIRNADSVKAVTGSQKVCIPCNKVYQETTGKRLYIKWKKNSDSEYIIQETDVDNVIIDGQNEKRIRYFDHDSTETNSFNQDSNAFKAGGCAECALIAVNAEIPSSTASDRTYTLSDKPIEQLYYVTCNQCHNGFAEIDYGSFDYWSNIETGKTTKGEEGTRKYQIQKYKKCQSCQYLINLHDLKLESANDFTGQLQDNRYKAVTRCKKLNVDTTKKSFFNYQITQCGSKNVDNYLKGQEDSSTDKSYGDRGTGYFSGITKDKITERTDVTNYFTDSENKLGKFRVNISQSGNSKYKLMQNLCVTNKNKCKNIIEISADNSSSYSNESTFSPLDSPRCSDCFTNYILTQDKTCVQCPYAYGTKGSETQNNSITEGCMQCQREELTVSDKTTKHSDKILCKACYNDQQQSSQVVRSKRTQTTTEEVGERKNYFYTQSDHKCTECNLGCLKCLNENKRCNEAQNFWRISENQDKDNTKFEKCQVDYCIVCEKDMNECDTCQSGYVPIKLFSEEENKYKYECERCDIGCLTCEADTLKEDEEFNTSIYNRKKCTACDTNGYYLNDQNQCIKKRANCINWQHQGGACLQCAHGYRLQEGWCYTCINKFSGLLTNGYWDCPAQCDSETGITAKTSNVRNAEALKVNAELTTQKNPATEPETPDEEAQKRILQLLDEFQPKQQL